MNVPVYDTKGKEVGVLEIDEMSLGGFINAPLIKQAFVMYHANQRQGSARTKSRNDQSYSGKKLGKQKGGGRARHGNRGVNLMRGGGRTFAKTRTREDYHKTMPKKMRRKANRNALLSKLIDGEVKVMADLDFETPKTRNFKDMLEALKIDRTVLLALNPENKNARLSARNIEDVTVCPSHQLNCFEMLNSRYMVITKADLEAWLVGPSSQTNKDARVNPMGRKSSEEVA